MARLNLYPLRPSWSLCFCSFAQGGRFARSLRISFPSFPNTLQLFTLIFDCTGLSSSLPTALLFLRSFLDYVCVSLHLYKRDIVAFLYPIKSALSQSIEERIACQSVADPARLSRFAIAAGF